MRSRIIGLSLLLIAAVSIPRAGHAAGSAPPPPPPPREMPSAASNAGTTDSTLIPGRADAEKSYQKGWEISEDAKKDLAAGKADNAKKKFGKALKKFREATDYDSKYFEAWNMVGFCSRKSGDLKGSFEAYHRCLEIEPEYAQAHEYLGEAYLMTGDVAKAKEQLLWLVSRKSDQAGELATKIEGVEKGGGAAQSDSTAKGGGW
ncbi:MAG TPA: tetratricopeptide repeat protein [Candidatus Saccharimonadales bacterium]|nr:tetratricopeptide repeat protein [Candidatus Saccharimonadales bacterium]